MSPCTRQLMHGRKFQSKGLRGKLLADTFKKAMVEEESKKAQQKQQREE